MIPVAQQSVDPAKVLEGWLWFGGFAVLVLVSAALLAYFWRRARRTATRSDPPVFDLEDLRRLRNSGELTIAEYEALKQRAIEDASNRTPPSDAGGEP